MPKKPYSPSDPEMDYVGNNAAFTCPHCRKVFIVSAAVHPTPGGTQGHDGQRRCPCGKSTGNVAGGKNTGGQAWIE
jgi:hypothetical protein